MFTNNDKFYYSKNYGIISKILKVWNKFLNIVNGLCILATFLMIPFSLGGIVYYSFVCYDFFRVLMFLSILYVMAVINKKL